MPDEPSLVIGLPRWIPPRRGAASPNPAEPIDVTVERIGAAGDGIARWQGHPVYLPFTLPGDRVRARLGARRGDGYEGHVVDLIAAAPGRITPPCRHFGACGGCALQHLDPEAYRRTKLDNLYAALARIHVDTGAVAPLQIVAPARRRARLGLRRPGDGEVRVGFRSRFRHALIDIEECPVLEPALLVAIGGLRAAGKDFLQPGEMAEASLTRTDSGVDLLLEGAAPPGLAALEALADVAAANDLARIVWRCRGEDTLVVERRPVRVLLSGHAVPFPPGGFLQANAAAERLLVAEVLAGAGARRPVLDLFAGLGTFALALAKRGPVHAVEGDATAAAALARAAAGRPEITVECRNLTRDPLLSDALADYAAVVFDPPRAGAVVQASALAGATADTVVAVSCNPATFARDASLLIDGGFRLERLAPIDQFVWSAHLELVGLFRR